MKRVFLFLTIICVIAAATGCGSTETSGDSAVQTEEIDLPPEDTDFLAVANEITIAFQSLYRNYLQVEGEELLFKIDKDYSSAVYFDDQPGYGYLPLINDEIRCCEDLKKILMEYCTDEFATVLLEAVHYRDFEGRLYKPFEDGRVDIGRAQFGCYIDQCTLDGNKMTVGFIEIGAENENFDIDTERYCRMSMHDRPFEMDLLWKNGKWFISDLSNSDPSIKGRPCSICLADTIAFSYREDITKSMHEAQAEMSPDTRTEETDLPPEDTDCLAVADECALAFQSLFLKYLQYEESELSIKFNDDPSSWIAEPVFYRPVIDDQIKCRDDLKNILTEYCTDNFAQELLDNAHYRDYDNAFYKGECELAPAAKYQFGCYINDCIIDGNKMTVDLINIGSENKNFDIDLEHYVRMMMYDQPFEMTLVWESGKWLISDISDGYEDKIGYSYRSDITKSMHETN